MRNLVFISHANPKENEFARWLGLQLVREGYLVWSDVTKLIGGESFWADIEAAIRNGTIKFVFVLSKVSNYSQGTLDELHLARTVASANSLQDFIIPVRVDDLAYNEVNVSINRLNIIDFTVGWASGLARLLEKLEKDSVPRDTTHLNASLVASWWKQYHNGIEILRAESEPYLSNWFPISWIPQRLYVHSYQSNRRSYIRGKTELPYVYFPIRHHLVSFATATDLGLEAVQTSTLPTWDCIKSDTSDSPLSAKEARNAFIYLLEMAWLSYVEAALMPIHKMANDQLCAYFTPTMFSSKYQSFQVREVISGRRSLVGQVKGKNWHFGITANIQLDPVLTYIIRSHVLFSDDGKNIWTSDARLHKARRSTCRNWWNAEWRDRILASMYWLAQKSGESYLAIPLSSEANLQVSIQPIIVTSPISYDETAVIEDAALFEERMDDDIETDSDEEDAL